MTTLLKNILISFCCTFRVHCRQQNLYHLSEQTENNNQCHIIFLLFLPFNYCWKVSVSSSLESTSYVQNLFLNYTYNTRDPLHHGRQDGPLLQTCLPSSSLSPSRSCRRLLVCGRHDVIRKVRSQVLNSPQQSSKRSWYCQL